MPESIDAHTGVESVMWHRAIRQMTYGDIMISILVFRNSPLLLLREKAGVRGGVYARRFFHKPAHGRAKAFLITHDSRPLGSLITGAVPVNMNIHMK